MMLFGFTARLLELLELLLEEDEEVTALIEDEDEIELLTRELLLLDELETE